MAIEVTVNGEQHQVQADGDTPLLWVLRDELRLTGTKYACGIAQCGACTVHVNGQPRRSCVLPVRLVEGARVTTIEGLS
ncbi:MAG: 2Fe-2S iron-sulfur cluster binding domain-containing protein, partial [Gammaproteobacteria bacterium]|nr:2Fe-2S iron-sulfur cluster binding domain-containing protein [Gammaproteobacteria bacterium]